MPPQLLAFYQQNQRLVMMIAIGLAVLVLGGIGWAVFGPKEEAAKHTVGMEKLAEKELKLAQVGNLGRAIEIQALLAREQIHVNLEIESETKVQVMFMKDTTIGDRDKAVLALVQSGLMDSNVGLEAFDKGDLTASREEKRIKLVRAQQGELARLIKKIDPIRDAAVSIAIPEPSIFRADEKPITASVQVSIDSGSTLSRDKVRAITNLVVGSIQGMDDKHVSISDTNGMTYNSILDSGADMNDTLKDQDSYMRQKIVSQLDRLVGAGNYTVTVSTELRQSPRETMVEQFDPQGAVLSSKQSFNENLNSNKVNRSAIGPATVMLPNNMENQSMSSNLPNAASPLTTILPISGAATPGGQTPTQPGGKDYLRNGVEVSYRNSKTQWLETSPAGMIEDITVAVTIDNNHYPDSMSKDDLQVLLARAASPKVRPENVSIAKSDIRPNQAMNGEGSSGSSGSSSGSNGSDNASAPSEAPSDMSWLLWAGGAVAACLLVILMLNMGNKPANNLFDESMMQAQHEMQQLREITQHQQNQLNMTQQQTQQIIESQQRQIEQALALEEQRLQQGQQVAMMPQHSQASNGMMESNGQYGDNGSTDSLEQTLDDLRHNLDEADDSDFQIQNWIESS
jgi:flagellar biosynthesis/type III secretory pathway M-ring protein FliF/YscJ